MYIVVIEWDGDKPPNTYYARMHHLGLTVRGDKELSPLKRRARSEGSVIAQEGAVLCASESLAHQVANYARGEGASVVKIGVIEPVDYYASTEDIQIMQRIESIYGKRGRPTGEKVKWAVTCLEETKSYNNDEAYAVASCPYCSGLRIRARAGEVDYYKFPDSGDVFDAWLRHRFVHGEFEVPEDGDNEPPATVQINHVQEHATTEIMRKSPDFLAALAKMPRNVAAKVMDAVMASRCHLPEETRRDRRLRSCIYLFERNVDPAKVSMIEKKGVVDILDAGAVIGSREAATLWMSVNKE